MATSANDIDVLNKEFDKIIATKWFAQDIK